MEQPDCPFCGAPVLHPMQVSMNPVPHACIGAWMMATIDASRDDADAVSTFARELADLDTVPEGWAS